MRESPIFLRGYDSFAINIHCSCHICLATNIWPDHNSPVKISYNTWNLNQAIIGLLLIKRIASVQNWNQNESSLNLVIRMFLFVCMCVCVRVCEISMCDAHVCVCGCVWELNRQGSRTATLIIYVRSKRKKRETEDINSTAILFGEAKWVYPQQSYFISVRPKTICVLDKTKNYNQQQGLCSRDFV